MKYAEELFPKGSFKGQETDGAYIDETLASNLDILAEKIVDDMHFMGVISGHDMVRDGKSTIATQVGSYLTWKINKLHKVENTFTNRNIVMKGRDLEEVSLSLPSYSTIILDEGDDLTTHGMKELAVKLKRYFRKCGQLNQILIIILPSFFELPKFFALSRSHFLIDVYFQGKYERGYFSFYSARNKKLLYLYGKKEWDYQAYKPDFKGRFFGSYVFFPDLDKCVQRYKDLKRKDLEDDANSDDNKKPSQLIKETTIKLFKQVYANLDDVSVEKLAHAFGVSERTGFAYLKYTFDKGNDDTSSVQGVG